MTFCTRIFDSRATGLQNFLLEVDGYFSLSDKAASIQHKRGYFSQVSMRNSIESGTDLYRGSIPTEMETQFQPLWKKSVKVITYATGVVPLVMLVAKIIFRLCYKFHVQSSLVEETLRKLEPKDSHVREQDILAVGDKKVGLDSSYPSCASMNLSFAFNGHTTNLRGSGIKDERFMDLHKKITSFSDEQKQQWCNKYEEAINSSIEFYLHLDELVNSGTNVALILGRVKKTQFRVFKSENDPYEPSSFKLLGRLDPSANSEFFPLSRLDVDSWNLPEEFKNMRIHSDKAKEKLCEFFVSHYRKKLLDYIRDPFFPENTVRKICNDDVNFTVQDITAIGERVLGLGYVPCEGKELNSTQQHPLALSYRYIGEPTSIDPNRPLPQNYEKIHKKFESLSKEKQQGELSRYEETVDKVIELGMLYNGLSGAVVLGQTPVSSILDIAKKTQFKLMTYARPWASPCDPNWYGSLSRMPSEFSPKETLFYHR